MRDLLAILAAVLAGFFLLGYDRRTDDTGVEPPIAAANAINGHPDVAAVVLAIGSVGAGLGWLMRRGSLAAR